MSNKILSSEILSSDAMWLSLLNTCPDDAMWLSLLNTCPDDAMWLSLLNTYPDDAMWLSLFNTCPDDAMWLSLSKLSFTQSCIQEPSKSEHSWLQIESYRKYKYKATT